jgi:hypothetical protein
MNVHVSIDKQTVKGLSIFVVDLNDRFISLMGRDWLNFFHEIDWNKFKGQKVSGLKTDVYICTKIVFIEISNTEMVKIIKNRFPQLINNGFGFIRNYQARIIMKPNSPATFHKPYDLALALREPVKKQLESEVKHGILER